MKNVTQESEQGGGPTKTEMEILQVLWDFGPSTVRFVNDTLNAQKKAVQYTSTLKQMQVMTKNGMLFRDETNMKHIYTAALEEQATKGLLLDKFVDTLYKGSPCNLIMQLLGNKNTSQAELDAIRALLDQQNNAL
jgi:predicted transcriptional regulator